MSYTDHLNANGLVDGRIPAGQPCPFERTCGHPLDRCPIVGRPREVPYLCALARGYSLLLVSLCRSAAPREEQDR